MGAAKKVKVFIAGDRHVMIDGRQAGPGELYELPEQEAETLIREGYAVKYDVTDAEREELLAEVAELRAKDATAESVQAREDAAQEAAQAREDAAEREAEQRLIRAERVGNADGHHKPAG